MEQCLSCILEIATSLGGILENASKVLFFKKKMGMTLNFEYMEWNEDTPSSIHMSYPRGCKWNEE